MFFSSKKPSAQDAQFWVWVILMILSTILAISLYIFVKDVSRVHREGIIHPQNPFAMIHSGSGKMLPESTIQDVDRIDTWMTFAYINFTFHLPENYLEDTLKISHPKYPKVSIGSYIRYKKLDGTVFLSAIKDAVRASFSPDFHRY